MKFYDAVQLLMHHVSTFGTGLLPVRDGMNCGCGEVPHNVTLCPIMLASKSYKVLSGTTAV